MLFRLPFSFCVGAHIQSTVKYPFSTATSKVTIKGGNDTDPIFEVDDDLPSAYMQGGQFFVVWGIFTIFYGIVALFVYMLTTANARMEWIVNYLVLSVSLF